MSSWSEERRLNLAAEAEQRRQDRDAEAERTLKIRAADDDRRRNLDVQKRRDKAQRRAARAARRERALVPGQVYRRGTLALVIASALASLPAQIKYFVAKSAMLLPVPFALEGAAWVMAAGVAYADERRLPGWVRWLLRALSMAAAGFAARINYLHGAETSATVGWGLAAVTLMGPLFFEVRQWVATLAAAGDPKRREERRRARHEKRRRRDHREVVELAWRLVSAAPYNTLSFEKAFAAAWEIKYGTQTPGMTPALHAEQLASRKALADALDAVHGSPVSIRGRLLEVLHPAPGGLFSGPGSSQVASHLPPSPERAPEGALKPARKGPKTKPVPPRRTKGDSLPFHPVAKTVAADTARKFVAVNGHHA